MNRDVAESYRWCWRVVRSSGSTFYRSFFLLQQPARDSMAALYAFSRITDDLGDNPYADHSETTTRKTELLDAWLARLAEAVNDSRPRASLIDPAASSGAIVDEPLARYEPLWPALADAVHKHAIPPRLLEDVVRGVKMDVRTVRIADGDELRDYCYHVASAVGLACTRIWNASGDLPERAAVECGIAFQLTNILRDVREDAAAGRIYVPQAMLRQHACSESAWLTCQPDGDWLRCVDGLYAAACECYAVGWTIREHLSADGRKMFSLMWRSYRQLLDEVYRRKAHLWDDGKVHLPRLARWRLAATHFVPSWYCMLPEPISQSARDATK